MPKLFKRVCALSLSVAGAAGAIQGAMVAGGATIPEWWEALLPYLLGIPAGMAFVAKLAVDGGYSEDKPKKSKKK